MRIAAPEMTTARGSCSGRLVISWRSSQSAERLAPESYLRELRVWTGTAVLSRVGTRDRQDFWGWDGEQSCT